MSGIKKTNPPYEQGIQQLGLDIHQPDENKTNEAKQPSSFSLEILRLQRSINQIKNSIKMITNRLTQAEERITGIKDKAEELLHEDDNQDKIQP